MASPTHPWAPEQERGGFVGRRPELAELQLALRDALSGSPRVVLVEGEAGIGKTALLTRFLDLQGGEVTMCRVRAEESERQLPFALVGQVVAHLAAAAGQPWPGTALAEGQPDPMAVGARLVQALEGVQSPGPVFVLVLEDVHFSDAPSTAALVFAFRRLLADRVLVLLTSRPVPLDPGWRRLVDGPGGRHLLLHGLGTEELRELARAFGAHLSDAALKRLGDVTDGHPLYASTVLAARAFPTGPELSNAAPPAPPPPLAELVVARLRNCSAVAQEVVAAASVLGRECGLVELDALVETGDLTQGLDEAMAVGLLEKAGEHPLRLWFPHALVRAACYQSLGRSRQVALHRRAAQVTSGEARLAHLLAASSGADRGLAAELETLADAELAEGALAAAAAHYRQAGEVSPTGPGSDRLLLQAMDYWLIAGEASQALALEDRARSSVDTPYRDYVLAYVALVSGRLPEADAGFRRAWQASADVRQLVGAPDDLAARVAVCMAILVVLTLATEEMLVWSERALASVGNERFASSFAWFCSALARGTLGRPLEALKALQAAEVPDTADVASAKGILQMWCDDLGPARENLSSAFARSLGGETVRVTQSFGFLSECEYRLGLLGESSVHAEMAVEAAMGAGRVWDLPLLHSLAAYPAATSGNFPLARTHVTEAVNWATLLPIPAFRAYANAAAATLALAEGNEAALLVAGQAIDDAYRAAEIGTSSLGPVLAEALLAHRRYEEAEESLADFERRASQAGRRSALVGSARVRGQLEAARGNHVGAGKAFALGARLARRLDLPLPVARLAEAHGRYLNSSGRTAEASQRLEVAVRLYASMGARPYLERAQLALSASLSGRRETELGAQRPVASVAPAISLSATETMVAHLVAEGRSNKQIANELVVSVKTVEYHLSNIYRRLGVTSRVKLAQLVRS